MAVRSSSQTHRGQHVVAYLIEVRDDRFERLASRAVSSDRVVDMADISRVKNVHPFSAEDVLRGQKVESLWTKGLTDEDGRLFTFWMMPSGGDQSAILEVRSFKPKWRVRNDSNVRPSDS